MRKIIFFGFLLTIVSPVFSEETKTGIREISSSDPKACSCSFPEFYFFCRTYLVKGKSHFEPFFVNRKGAVEKAPELKLLKFREFHPAADTVEEIQGKADPLDRVGVYPGKNWKVRIIWNTDGKGSYCPMYLKYKEGDSAPVKSLEIPQGDSSFSPRSLFFDLKRNLFFFEYVDGATGARDIWLWVFNLKNKRLNKIGETSGSRYFMDSSRRWLVWTDSKQKLDVIGDKHVESGHVVSYDMETGKKYQFTNGNSIGFFYNWKKDQMKTERI